MAGRKIYVMIVDDEEAFARNLARLLGARGFNVTAVFDGYSAIEHAAEKSPDLVLLDVKMPGIDGNQVLSRLKSMKPDIEVIMLTGHGDVDSGVDAIREGAFDYLLKPCDIETINEKIRDAAAAREMKHHPVLWPRKLVKEAADSVFIPLKRGDSLYRALEIFENMGGGISRKELHVTDEDGQLAGVVTKKDLVQAACPGDKGKTCTWLELSAHPEWLPNMPISEVMQEAPGEYARPDEALSEVAGRMLNKNLYSLPVVDESEGRRFLGVIYLRDVLKHAAFMQEEEDNF